MTSEVLQAVIIAVGNFGGILAAYYLLDRRIEGKILKYWRRIKASEEGHDLFTILSEGKKLIKSEETQRLFKEFEDLISEFRALLKKIKEKSEASEEEDAEESLELPKIGEKIRKRGNHKRKA